MYSTPDRSLGRRCVLPAALLAALLGGCAQKAQQAYTPPPLIIDGAMQRREWERSVAYYPNGDTRFPMRTETPEDQNEYGLAAFDIVASMVETVALPFTYIFIPPFAPAVYRAEDVPPTYTAMPQMRPPVTTVQVDGLTVDRDTLEIRARPKQRIDERYRRYGPMGPNDSEFMSETPIPAEDLD
jgi:hypothetical protein